MSFVETCASESRQNRVRLLRNLSAPGAKLMRRQMKDQISWVLIRSGGEARTAWCDNLIKQALASGVVDLNTKEECRITKAGRAALRRALSGAEAYSDQHRTISYQQKTEDSASKRRPAPIRTKTNLDESPLARLAVRKGKNGKPLLEPEQVRAGERLRADYTFAAMMPAIGQGWRTERIGSGPARSGLRDLSDDVLSARQRVERILASMEPVLAGVIVDVCCHLKGLEKIEEERGWPARCAKIVLQIGLSALVERYGERTQAAAGHGHIHTWQAK